MVTNGDHQTWVPYEPTKDCSLGSCSFYCPQWCSINFPPPPPDDSSGRTFSPLVIAVIGVLAGAFLLVSYYTIFYKYCGTFNSRRERQRQRRHGPGSGDHGLDSYNFDQAHLHETWHFPPSNGLDEALIDEITVCKYKGGDGLIEATECAVCLSEFREDESLRLLPKCSHAFHVQCIDTWLKSHSNCPLCRANVVSVDSTPSWPPPQLPAPPPPPPPPEADNNALVEEREHDEEMVSTMESPVTEGDEEAELASVNDHLSKNPLQVHCSSGVMEENSTVVEIRENDDVHPIRRSFSMDCSSCARVPTIAEALQMSLVDEVSAGASSSRRCGGEQSKGNSKCRGGLHCVMSPLPMNRSFSSSRLCLTRHVKGRNAILPV